MAAMFCSKSPCSRGHVTERYVSTGQCIACHVAWQREYEREHYKDPIRLMARRARFRTRKAILRAGYTKRSTTNDLLGCDWPTLKAHIESQFVDGMSWDNMDLWHMDHRTPLAKARSEEELKQLCHYTNLQPLWAADNLRKHKT